MYKHSNIKEKFENPGHHDDDGNKNYEARC